MMLRRSFIAATAALAMSLSIVAGSNIAAPSLAGAVEASQAPKPTASALAPLPLSIGQRDADVAWTAPSKGLTVLTFGSNSPYERLVASSSNGTEHLFALRRLECGTTYQLHIWSFSPDGQASIAPDSTVTTSPCDSPPWILEVGGLALDKTSAIISTLTDVPSEVTVSYETTDEYGSALRSSRFVTDHHVLLVDLACDTTYRYWVSAANTNGSHGTTQDSVTTARCNTPAIGPLTFTQLGDEVRVEWTTDIVTTTTIQFNDAAPSTAGNARQQHNATLEQPACDSVAEITVAATSITRVSATARPWQLVGPRCDKPSEGPVRLIAIGDSITEGDHQSVTYRPLLAAALSAGGLTSRSSVPAMGSCVVQEPTSRQDNTTSHGQVPLHKPLLASHTMAPCCCARKSPWST
jgi:hypothetical protein